MAYSAGSSQKDHCGGYLLSQNHGVVAGTADHAVRLATYASHCAIYFADEKFVHFDGALVE
jgi:hypothetical protein